MDFSDRVADLTIENRPSTSLPDEVWLRAICYLRIADPVDIEAIQSLGSTSRKLRELTSDQTNIRQMLVDQELGESSFFIGTIWTPGRLGKLSILTNESRTFLARVWDLWMEGFQPPDLPIIHREVLYYGHWAATKIFGLDAPDYTLVPRASQALNVSMLAAALMYQQVFLNRWFVYVPGRDLEWTLDAVRRALRFVFLCKGPMVASRLLETPSRLSRALEAAVPQQIRDLVGPGQTIITTHHRNAGGPVASWTLENAIVHERRSGWAQPPFASRVDKRVEGRMAAITGGWIASGNSMEYLGPEDYKTDLVWCLAAWQTGNDLL